MRSLVIWYAHAYSPKSQVPSKCILCSKLQYLVLVLVVLKTSNSTFASWHLLVCFMYGRYRNSQFRSKFRVRNALEFVLGRRFENTLLKLRCFKDQNVQLYSQELFEWILRYHNTHLFLWNYCTGLPYDAIGNFFSSCGSGIFTREREYRFS